MSSMCLVFFYLSIPIHLRKKCIHKKVCLRIAYEGRLHLLSWSLTVSYVQIYLSKTDIYTPNDVLCCNMRPDMWLMGCPRATKSSPLHLRLKESVVVAALHCQHADVRLPPVCVCEEQTCYFHVKGLMQTITGKSSSLVRGLNFFVEGHYLLSTGGHGGLTA